MDYQLKKSAAVILLVTCFCCLSVVESQAQAMVSKGQEVQLIWYDGITTMSFENIQVETTKGGLQFIVRFQLPSWAPGVNKKAYSLPLYWISDFGTFVGTGTVTPNGQVIARFHVKAVDR